MVLTRSDGHVTQDLAKIAVIVTALLTGSAAVCLAADDAPERRLVEIENPLASFAAAAGLLCGNRAMPGPSPAVVLLHGCNGNWQRLDERWGKRIASWGYVTLTVDSFGPRGIDQHLQRRRAARRSAFDAYRALNFPGAAAIRRSRPRRRARLFARRLAGAHIGRARHRSSRHRTNKFRAAVAFYPPCLGFKGNMTVPTLILIGELDDWTPAERVPQYGGRPRRLRDIAAEGPGRSDQARRLSRRLSRLRRVRTSRRPFNFSGHHLEFNQSATDQSIDALRKFLDATIGGREKSP